MISSEFGRAMTSIHFDEDCPKSSRGMSNSPYLNGNEEDLRASEVAGLSKAPTLVAIEITSGEQDRDHMNNWEKTNITSNRNNYQDTAACGSNYKERALSLDTDSKLNM